MSFFLSKEVREGLALAIKADRKKKSRLRVSVGDKVYPILRFDDSNFTIDADDAPHLRGLVDIYDGARHLYQALIVASELEDDVMRFEFKRNTPALDGPALDFDRDENAPIALLPVH